MEEVFKETRKNNHAAREELRGEERYKCYAFSNEYRDELKAAIEEAYRFVMGNEYEWKDNK